MIRAVQGATPRAVLDADVLVSHAYCPVSVAQWFDGYAGEAGDLGAGSRELAARDLWGFRVTPGRGRFWDGSDSPEVVTDRVHTLEV